MPNHAVSITLSFQTKENISTDGDAKILLDGVRSLILDYFEDAKNVNYKITISRSKDD